MHKALTLAAAVALFPAIFTAAAAQEAEPEAAAVAALQDRDGQSVGEVRLYEAPHGLVLRADLENLPAGEFGFHIHAVGKCTPDFDAAGGHFNPTGSEHGFLNEKGYHRGDMPNITVPESGMLRQEIFLPNLTVRDGKGHALLDKDGAAIMIHEGADDHRSDPAGHAGTRIACGVIEAADKAR